jgi:hypothetical protein
MGVRGSTDDEEVSPVHEIGAGVTNGNDSHLILRAEAGGDSVGDEMRVAIHGFVHDECSH